MKPRGSYDRSDYAWSAIAREAANFLMDEGAGDRPLSFEEIAKAIRNGNTIPEGDFRRAAYQVESHEDKDRGAEILAAEALAVLKRSKLVVEDEEGWRWIGNGRASFTAHGTKLPLVPREERERLSAQAQVEAQFITPELQLPKRTFNPETAESKALIASLVAVGFDDDFKILVDKDGIVDGYQRAGACEYINEHGLRAEPIEWREHCHSIGFQHGPLGNIERTGKQVRANIGTPLSDATRRAVAAKLRIDGHTGAEIAEALGVSLSTVKRDLRSGSEGHVTPEPPAPRLSDDELVSLAMEEIRAYPDKSKNWILKRLSAAGHAFAKDRGLRAYDVAQSRLATSAPAPASPPPAPIPPTPAPAPPPPEPVSEISPTSPDERLNEVIREIEIELDLIRDRSEYAPDDAAELLEASLMVIRAIRTESEAT